MPRVAEVDLYATLGVSPSATPSEIAAAFRAHAKEWHPDLHAGAPAAAERYKALTHAYDVLIRPSSRAAYDRRRAGPAHPSSAAPVDGHGPVFRTARGARLAVWSGVALVLLGLAGAVVLAAIDTGDTAKTITLWLVVAKLVICGAILWGAGVWRRRPPSRATSVTAQ